MTEVSLITVHGRYRGALNLVSSAGQPVRFLDLLNFPQRLQPGATRSGPGLVLQRAVRADLRSGENSPACESLYLRAEAIIAGWETEAVAALGVPGAMSYERRQASERQRVVLFTTNGLRIEASMIGGVGALDPAKNAGKNFLACTEVMLIDPAASEPPRFIPFLAVNLHHLEGYGAL